MSEASLARALSSRQLQRLQYIESMAYWEGAVPRERVCERFGLSANHITKIVGVYRKRAPKNLDYDPSARTWRASEHFRPAVCDGTPEEYLTLLRLGLEDSKAVPIPGIIEAVPSAAMPIPHWPADASCLRYVTRAVRERTGVSIEYQSMRHADPVARTIWPHALVYAGFRWHVRAYDGLRQRFADFVLARICKAKPNATPSPSPPSQDKDWHQEERVDVVPSPKLSAAQRKAIAREYGMTSKSGDWVWSASMPRSLVGYFLRWHRLDDRNALSRVTVRNWSEVRKLAFDGEED